MEQLQMCVNILSKLPLWGSGRCPHESCAHGWDGGVPEPYGRGLGPGTCCSHWPAWLWSNQTVFEWAKWNIQSNEPMWAGSRFSSLSFSITIQIKLEVWIVFLPLHCRIPPYPFNLEVVWHEIEHGCPSPRSTLTPNHSLQSLNPVLSLVVPHLRPVIKVMLWPLPLSLPVSCHLLMGPLGSNILNIHQPLNMFFFSPHC